MRRDPRGLPRRSFELALRIGFYINAVREVDWSAENFLADFYWWIRYAGPASDDDQKHAEAPGVREREPGRRRRGARRGPGTRDSGTEDDLGPDGAEMYVAFRSVGRF
jgi:hypothetical protein